MNIKRKSRNPRAVQLFVDLLHMAACLVIVCGSLLAIWDTDTYAWLFPVVFMAAAVLNLAGGLFRLSDGGDRKKQHIQAILQLLVAAALFLIALISIATVRGR